MRTALKVLAVLALAPMARADNTPVGAVVFRPLDLLEQRYIYRDLGSQTIPDERSRFHDANAYIVYRFAFVPGTQAALSMRISAQFRVDVSDDGEHFDAVADYTRSKGDPLVLDLTPYTKGDGLVYVRVGDAKPDDGWGGKIHEVTVTGFLRDVPVSKTAGLKPIFLSRRSHLYAHLAPPDKHLYQFEARGASMPEAILFRSLQGLVNRRHNELWIGESGGALEALKVLDWVDGVTTIPTAEALFERYGLRDCVVWDPKLYGSENLAVMIGAMEGWLVAHPSLVAKYRLRVREDLRGRWTRTLDGYKAVHARYRGQFNRRTLVMCAPSKRPALYDYAMAHKTFTFWIVGGTDADRPGADRWAEEEWFERTLGADFPVNIPILGYPQVEPCDGIGENRGVALFSRSAKFLVPADHMSNMTLLSAYPNARGKVRIPRHAAPALDREKVYASLVLSDGDNQCLWAAPNGFMFGYMKAMKAAGPREFAVSYTMAPNIVDLNPLGARMVNEFLEPQDSIGGAVSGVGYMYMSHYANNFGADRAAVVREYIDLTARYLKHAGERWNWIMDYGGPGSVRLQDYARLEGCVALMGGYGRETTDPAKTAEPVGKLVAFHSVSRMVQWEDVLKDVQRVTRTGVRPLFLHVFIGNWGINPDQYRALAEALRAEGVEVVTPEVLAQLYWEAAK